MEKQLAGIVPGAPHANRTGTINHLRLTVSDIAGARTFYTSLMKELGYRLVEESDTRLAWASWAPHGTLQWFILGVANPQSPNIAHDRYSPGFHHLAWNVMSREEVIRIHDVLSRNGVEILDAPTEYEYEPGYYAFFFADPDGLKLEIMHVPVDGSLAFWRTLNSDGSPSKSRPDSEPAFLRDNRCC